MSVQYNILYTRTFILHSTTLYGYFLLVNFTVQYPAIPDVNPHVAPDMMKYISSLINYYHLLQNDAILTTCKGLQNITIMLNPTKRITKQAYFIFFRYFHINITRTCERA